jgi:hypothetical protein
MKESRGDQPHELSVNSIEVTGESSAVSPVRDLVEVAGNLYVGVSTCRHIQSKRSTYHQTSYAIMPIYGSERRRTVLWHDYETQP